MTADNYDRKKQYAALIMAEYPSFPDDPMVLAQQIFGDSEVTDEAWEAAKAKLSHRVGYYCLRTRTAFSALLAKGMTVNAALAEVRDNFSSVHCQWMETPAMLRQRAKNAKEREKWLRGLQRRVGT